MDVENRTELLKFLAIDVLFNPWFDVGFFKSFSPEAKKKAIEAILDVSRPLSSIMGGLKNQSTIKYLLALRGLLGFGLLENGLEKRYEVQYGFDERRTTPFAVPYRAADLPAERAEFSHPDNAALMTTLSFYYKGLNRHQLLQSIVLLLQKGQVARNLYYDSWLESVRSNLADHEFHQIRAVSMIDLSNTQQTATLEKAFSKCMEVINYYLLNFVFTSKFSVYPEKLSGSAWTLKGGMKISGFSGTNEISVLNPTWMQQIEPDISSLQATNARMMDYISRFTTEMPIISRSSNWKDIISEAFKIPNIASIIDAGALLGKNHL
jgi:hypothetical protein